MAKLFASSTISALSLAITIGAAGASHLQSPAALHHLHDHLVQQTLRDIVPPHHRRAAAAEEEERNDLQQLHRFAQVASTSTDDDCPGTPFLWKITEDATGKHVGFGLGTMHLPVDVVITEDAYNSITAAIEDSCDVYGELNFLDGNVTAEVMECLEPLAENSATVDDIPDEELREAIKAKMLEIGIAIDGEGNATVAEFYATRLLRLPLSDVQKIFLFSNTPEYRDKYLHTILSDSGTVALDTHVLSLGRPADDLEEVSTQCDLIKEIYPSAEEISQNFDLYSTSIKNSLNASLTKEIEKYKCGDIDAFVEEFSAGMAIDGFDNDFLLSDRNIQMAAKMNDTLKANPDEKIMFAVGNAHWIIGTQSLELLLKDYGYTLEHVPNWDSEDAENLLTDEQCGVIFNPETGLFDPAPDGWFVPGPSPTGITKEPTHSVVLDTYYTLPPAPANENSTMELTKVTNTPTSPTKMPSGGDTGEGGPAAAANAPSSSTTIGTSKMVFAGGFIYLWNCI